MTVFQRGHDTDDTVSLVPTRGLGRGGIEGPLRLDHCFALGFCCRKILATGDRLGLCNLAGLVVHDDLGELVPLHRVDGKLKHPVLHFILRRNRFAFLGTCRESTLQRDLRGPQRLGKLRMLRVVGLLRHAQRHREHPPREERQRQRCSFHVFPSRFPLVVA